MIKSIFKFSVLILFVFVTQFYLSSCGNSSGSRNVIIDSDVYRHDSFVVKQKADSANAADAIENKVEHISKTDSIKVADSVKRAKNPIRDFN